MIFIVKLEITENSLFISKNITNIDNKKIQNQK